MNNLINYLIEASLVLSIGILFYKVLFARLTFFSWNRAFLIFVLFLIFILPAITFNLDFEALEVAQTFNAPMDWSRIQVDETSLGASEKAINFGSILIAVYLLGVVFFTLRLMVGIIQTLLLIGRSVKYQEGDYLVVINSRFTPASFFKYILLPSFDPTNAEHRQIVTHESVHVQKLHSLDVLLVQIAKVALWFNPLVYLFEQSVREIHEFQADETVAQSFSPVDYSRLLLKQLCVENGLQFMNNFNQFQTKKRIIMMNKTKSNQFLKARFLLSIPLLMVMIGLFSCDMAGKNDKILGIWNGSDFAFEQSEGPDMAAMIEGGKQLHIDGKLIVNDDATYQIAVGNGGTNGSGTWKVEGDNFITTDGQGNVTIYEIKELTTNQLVTEQAVKMDTPMGTIAGKITLTYTR